jgi:hypothetical protein
MPFDSEQEDRPGASREALAGAGALESRQSSKSVRVWSSLQFVVHRGAGTAQCDRPGSAATAPGQTLDGSQFTSADQVATGSGRSV